MFFKGPVDGLLPGASYDVTVSVEIATDVPAGCVGVGGAPGESVWVKAGATAVEPLPIRDGGYLRMNIDVGNQSAGGSAGRGARRRRQLETLRGAAPVGAQVLRGQTDTGTDLEIPASGRAWLFFGVDSGFEAGAAIYFTRAEAAFRPI